MKRNVIWLMCIGIAVIFIGSSSMAWGENIEQTQGDKTTYVFKMATIAPEQLGWAALIRDIVNPGIDKATNGRVVLDWYYGGRMGDDTDILAKMINGQLQGGGFSGHGMVILCPEMTLFALPFLFDNYDEVEYVYSKMRPRINEWFEKRGYHLVILAEQGFDQIYSTKREIRTFDDIKKSRFQTWYGPMEEKTLKALGASPVPVRPIEVSAAVRTGICDALISPAIWAVGSQFYTVMKYINPVHIRYSPAGGVVSLKAWNKLPKEDQLAIDNYVKSTEKEFRQKIRAINAKGIAAMYQHGMKEVKMTPAEIDAFKKKLLPVWDEFAAKGYYSKDDLDYVKNLLAELRSKK
ncbi:MAG: TRAP transporter substrate-binding protein DctP [Smithella sp.]